MDSIILYRSEIDMLLALKRSQGMSVLEALFYEEKAGQLPPLLAAIHAHIRQHAVLDKERYERRKEMTKKRVQKYRQSKEPDEGKEPSPEAENDVTHVTQCNALKRCVTLNDNDNDNGNDNVNDNENENVNDNGSIEEETSSSSMGNSKGGRRSKDEEEEQREKLQKQKAEVRRVFNEIFANSKIPKLRIMTDKRWEMYVAIRKAFSGAELTEGLRKAAVLPKLNGGGKDKYVATYDWMMQPENFLKILEGNYG